METQAATDSLPRVAEHFLSMVRIDSESGSEDEFLDYLRRYFEVSFAADCVYDAFGNLIARVRGAGSARARPVLLCGHADTIKPSIGVKPVVDRGIIRSSGDTVLGADNKAGIAEIIEAIATAENRPPLEVLITREEEVGLKGSRNLDASLVRADCGFVVDIQALEKVIVGGPSHYVIDVEVIGRSAHAGLRPEQGLSAIRAAALAIAAAPNGRIDKQTTANIGTILGGEARNAVPARVSISAECRSLDHARATSVMNEIERCFRDAARETGAEVSFRQELQTKASRIPDDCLPVRVARGALMENGIAPDVVVSTAGTDAIFLNEKGIQSVVIGFGGQGAHTVEERIAVVDMVKAVGTVRNIIEALA